MWRVWKWVICAKEECIGYDTGQYVEDISAEGMTVGNTEGIP